MVEVRHSWRSAMTKTSGHNGRSNTVVLGHVPLTYQTSTTGAGQEPATKPKGCWRILFVILWYARVSTKDQNLDGRRDAFASVGAERIFAETITETVRSRPALDRLPTELRPGDVVVTTKYVSLALSLKDLLETVDQVEPRGAGFRSLAKDIDPPAPPDDWCSSFSHPTPSSNASASSNGARRDWRQPESVAVPVGGPLPYRSFRCEVRKMSDARSRKSPRASSSAQRPSGARPNPQAPRIHSKSGNGPCTAHDDPVPARTRSQKCIISQLVKWCPGAESNHRHEDFQSTALPLSYPGTGLRRSDRRRVADF
jgi:hypothetical protein